MRPTKIQISLRIKAKILHATAKNMIRLPRRSSWFEYTLGFTCRKVRFLTLKIIFAMQSI